MVVNYVNTFGIEHGSGIPDGAFGCVELADSVGPRYWATASLLIARISIILVDIIVLVVTWLATYKEGLITVGAKRHSLLFVMLYNGTCYFSVILIFNILHISLAFASPEVGFNTRSFTSHVTAFTQPITNILIARFLIDLQATNRATMNINGPAIGDASQQSSSSSSDVDSLRFGGFIGSIGSVLTGDFGEAGIADLDLDDSEELYEETRPAPGPSQQSISGDEA